MATDKNKTKAVHYTKSETISNTGPIQTITPTDNAKKACTFTYQPSIVQECSSDGRLRYSDAQGPKIMPNKPKCKYTIDVVNKSNIWGFF